MPFKGLAQQTEDIEALSLDEAIELAKEYSPFAITARYQLTASQWSYQSYRADLLPGLSVSGNAPNYNRNFRELLNSDGSTSVIYTQQSNASVTARISQPVIYTGGSLNVTSGIQRHGIFYGENTYQWTSTPVSISYNQPLFAFNNLKWRRRIEPMQLEAARKEYVEDIEELSLTVTRQYFDVLLAKINLDIAGFNVSVNDSVYNISQGRYNVGSIAENDLLQSELELRNAESTLSQTQISYEQQLKEFRLILGLESDTPIDVELPPDPPELDIDAQLALEMALQNNSTFLNFEIQETLAERTLDQAVKQNSFQATASISYGLSQTSPDFDMVYQDPLNRQGVNFQFQVPIYNWGKQQAEVNAARNTQRRVTDDITYDQRQFELEVENSVDEFRQLFNQYQLAELSDQIAERRYNVARDRYRIGRIDITNLFIAQRERDTARRNYIQALRNYWIGIYTIRSLTLYDFRENRIIEHDF
ncbi:MAG: TolC family protein [Balneolales bacterium]